MFSRLPVCERLEGRQLLSGTPYSNWSLLGYYEGSVTVKTGGVTTVVSVALDIIPQGKNQIVVEGNIDGCIFTDCLTGTINKKGYFDYKGLSNDDTTFLELNGCITTVGKGKSKVELLTGVSTFSTTLGTTAQITVDGNFQFDQIFTLPAEPV